jgi:hypothetical protein
MKKLIAVMQKREVSREEMAEKLEEILIPIAEMLNDETPVYHGFPVETMALKGSDKVFIIGFNNSTLALINLEKSFFSVFGSPKYDLTAEEHAVISHLWEGIKSKQSEKQNMETFLNLLNLSKGDN